MHEKKGLVYQVLDAAGNKIGTPIIASQFYNKPTKKILEVKFKQNGVLREHFPSNEKSNRPGHSQQKYTGNLSNGGCQQEMSSVEII